ncbi:MAG: tripartite tricarboxylate transporter substrate binding protein [Betaproteobacteria bacterium]|nr:tripartite tricarboxylate transporter substrate binding protein [Betaproteobacteria bacterium]
MFRFLPRIVLVCLTAAAQSGFAQTGDYPNRPVRLIVAFPPGASFDIVTRILAEKMTPALGQPVLVENRPGAAGMIGMQAVARATPDGYTLVTFNTDLVGIVPALQKVPPYDPQKDFAYVGTLMRGTGFIVAVNPKLPIHSINDLVKFAKSSPNALNYGSYGVGSLPHLGFEALKARLGINMVHVPYKGGMQSYQAAMINEVQFVAGTSFIDMLKSGQLRGLAIGGQKRSPQLPDIPTFPELNLGDDMFGPTYLGLAAPAGTPQPILNRLSAELRKISLLPDVVERLGKFSEASFASPDELTAMVRRDVNFYESLIKSLGLSNQ